MQAVKEHAHFIIPAVGLALTAGATFAPIEGLDACYAERDDSLETKENDFVLQMAFIASSVAAAAFTALALLKNTKRAMFVSGLAVFGYAYRVLVHILLIRQIGTLDEPHCGTVKSISGHVHFFVFHIVFFACAYLQFCTKSGGSGPAQRTHSVQRKKKSGKKSSSNEVTLDELAEFVGYLGYAVMLGSAYLSLHATYFSGFHSGRQMLAGAAFAFGGSIVCQVVGAVAEPLVVGSTKKRGPKAA
mmetsp:Transcript_17269/g.55432  ORF Transcript_17269/g.55432 Transcript_17269/m.55432 type:complete len:245 (-) Transcript_17269:55-789(-)|eukprot:CAMPEP_0196781550 /NCGR_PEP_ID=MMETSP1104-20130614/9772_1 /TAXON_ID=33652 /ORGANISM="Cafeteria sp., Strain Caron Lab Isolate" /LENGTH=244 /DNA_ID=CAMNT_0042151783 /DNA_START=28 /DNA_END=762 /DNA_ORIENTATION=+